MMQEAVVTIIIVWAAYVVAKRYAPKILRRKLNALMARAARQSGLPKLATRFELKVMKSNACADDGCGACGGCKANHSTSTEKRIVITPRTLK
jgi:hypothetical protein